MIRSARKPQPDVMTLGEVSRYLRVHPSTVYRLLKKHAIPGFKIGSDWRFSRDRLDRWRERIEDDAMDLPRL